jgi:hypothetical protein
MASHVPPKKATAFDLGLNLYTSSGALIVNPAPPNAQVSKDFGAYASASSVSVASTEYGAIKLALDSTEMNADVVMVRVSSSDANVVPFTATIYTAANLMDGLPDAFLDRDMSVGVDSGSSAVRTPRQALRYLRNKWSLDGSTLTVTKEDDSTPSWTAVVSTAATAEAITGIDPA